MWSLAQTLERIGPRLPAALVPVGALDGAAAVAARLPAALTDCIYFERRLGDDTPRVDLILRVDTERRSLLADLPARFADVAAAHDAWPRLASFARAWSAEGSALDRQVEAVWIEFDLPASGGVPVPRLFVDFRHEDGVCESVTRPDLALDVLRALLGADLDPAVEETIRAGFDRLPSGAFVPYVGLTPGVPTAPIRICVQGLRARVVSYLAAVAWPGDGADLGELLATLAEAKGDTAGGVSVLHLDLAPHVAPRIGLEYAFARAGQWEGKVEETGFLDHLVARGYCSSDVREGLLRWPGRDVELMPHEIWPSHVGRRLAHVKVTYASGQDTVVKVYLCVLFEPARGATLLGTRPFAPRAGALASRQPRAIE